MIMDTLFIIVCRLMYVVAWPFYVAFGILAIIVTQIVSFVNVVLLGSADEEFYSVLDKIN